MSETEYQPKSGVRYGGPHSLKPAPTGNLPAKVTRERPKRGPVKHGGRKRIMSATILALPLLFAGFVEMFDGNAFGAIRDFALYGLTLFSLGVIGTGITAHEEYDRREFASAPALPRKILGSAMLGATIALTCFTGWGIGLVQSLGFGILGGAAAILSVGIDPLRGKGETTATGVTPAMVVDAVNEAEAKIDGIERAAADIRDRPLRDRLARVTRRARDILLRIEQDPSDLRRSKKFLVVYLDGALEATRKYARSQDDLKGDSQMYMKFRALLDDMEREFDRQYEKLLTNDRIDLDVEIDVLADRLKNSSAL